MATPSEQPRTTVRFGNHRIPVPSSRVARIAIGWSLIVVGIVGIPFPIIGPWMVPPGLLILSNDSHRARRFRRRSEVWGLRRWRAYRARRAERRRHVDPLPQA